MTTGHKIFIQLNSGDFSIRNGDNAQSFRNTLASPFKLDIDKDYEVSMFDCQIPIRQDTSSVYVNCSLVQSAIVGSMETNTLCWIPNSEIAPALGNSIYYTTQNARKWFAVAQKNIPYIDISFTLSTGSKMPINVGDYSTVTIAIREIVY